ncbi:single-stranded DNA-binding protein [Bacillus phage vB_BhaS-171]|uniref:single strand DNA binding protein n=1 Tax=Bacillus phage vB_BhaS-171 TaxID=1775140 RepID=UPI0007449BF7|nr:single strand DNA binding protein [Bacillus phage vB_BhaS-171]ALY08117.1 single-stranded DNA-binding protein [Bacillus phage vB_BhaS-171]
MNNVSIIGNISTDIDLRATNSGKFVAKFNIAVNHPFKRDKVSFLPVEIWDKAAEATGNYCQKGSKVGIVGYIEVEEWEKDGSKRYKTKVVANNIEFLTPKGENKPKPAPNPYQEPSDPFRNEQPIDISDDSLPF